MIAAAPAARPVPVGTLVQKLVTGAVGTCCAIILRVFTHAQVEAAAELRLVLLVAAGV